MVQIIPEKTGSSGYVFRSVCVCIRNERSKDMADRIDDLEVWQLGMDIAVKVYALTRNGILRSDYGLSDQIKRSSVSIPANVAEGFGRFGRKEFGRFVLIARGSSFELLTLLKLSSRIDDSLTEHAGGIIELVEREIAKLTSFRNQLTRDDPQ